jgi:hypothetical protein
MYAESRRFSKGALAGAIALAFTTLLMPFGSLLFGHVLAAALVYGAWVVLGRYEDASVGRLFGVGALIGAAVLVEYTAVLAGIVIMLVAITRIRWRAAWVIAGGLPFAVLLGWYNARAFGDPWTVSYSFSAFDEVTEEARSVLSIFGSFSLGNLFDLFFSFRGFLVATPFVIVALLVAAGLATKVGSRIQGAIPLVIFGLYLLIPLFWGNPWGGDSPGPRYMVTALPFLAVPAAVAFERLKRAAWAAALIGGATMLSATVTDPMLERSGNWGINVWARWVAEGHFVPNLPELVLGVPRFVGLTAILTASAGAGVSLVRANRRRSASNQPDESGRYQSTLQPE